MTEPKKLTPEEFAGVRASLILPSTKQGVTDYLAFVTNMREFVHAYDVAIARAEAAERELERKSALIKTLEKRIRKQRIALRENWEIIEMRASYPRDRTLQHRMLECALKHNRERIAAGARVKELENQLVLSRAMVEGTTSLLLSTQNDCIEATQKNEELQTLLDTIRR